MLGKNDFNVVVSDANGFFIRIEELNKMIEFGAIAVNKGKLEEYKKETRVVKS